jgi:hypothetical protein
MLDRPATLVEAIARSLRAEGSFVAHLDAGDFGTGQLQAVVDVAWAARRAGRLLDRPVRVSTERADALGSLILTAVFADS